jgi:hypothetical protein
VMVEPFVHRIEEALHVAVVDRPAQGGVEGGGEVQAQEVAVAVQNGVGTGAVGAPVRCWPVDVGFLA